MFSPFIFLFIIVIFLSSVIVKCDDIGPEDSYVEEFRDHKNFQLLPPLGDCGGPRRWPSSSRIYRGEATVPKEYPWMVPFFSTMVDLSRKKTTCGGAVINNRYVLTAGHCCWTAKLADMSSFIQIGGHLESDLNDLYLNDCIITDGRDTSECDSYPKIIEVESMEIHPAYDVNTRISPGDICLVRLMSTLHYDEHVYPICLPTYDKIVNNQYFVSNITLAGWGTTDQSTKNQSTKPVHGFKNDEYARVLQKATMSIVHHQLCLKDEPTVEHDLNICAIEHIGNNSVRKACFGDSGGPAMADLQVNGIRRYFAVGVASGTHFTRDPSTRKRLCYSQKPDIYTRVSSYMKWILDVIY